MIKRMDIFQALHNVWVMGEMRVLSGGRCFSWSLICSRRNVSTHFTNQMMLWWYLLNCSKYSKDVQSWDLHDILIRVPSSDQLCKQVGILGHILQAHWYPGQPYINGMKVFNIYQLLATCNTGNLDYRQNSHLTSTVAPRPVFDYSYLTRKTTCGCRPGWAQSTSCQSSPYFCHHLPTH